MKGEARNFVAMKTTVLKNAHLVNEGQIIPCDVLIVVSESRKLQRRLMPKGKWLI